MRTGRPFELRLLGGFELLANGEPVALPESAQRLVAFLALCHRPMTRLRVAGNLWPDKNDQRATANLRSALWRARLGDGSCVVQVNGPMLGLCPSTVLDVAQLSAVTADDVLADLESSGPADYARLFDETLADWYDDWVIVERGRIAQLQLRIAVALARDLIARGDHFAALDLAFRTVALDPLGEVKDRILGWIP
ncbi:MAG: transcriptional regulator, family [Ilumatobacteraceae bacterium]|nr:transcriptional regulator, family [Ilumatobacteraceae bacterium]